MNYIKRPIIGVKGSKGSGKDTVASMIVYIMEAGYTAATFEGWENYNKSEKDELDIPIRHFADKIKDDLSIMFNINRECFDSSEYKDKLYYHFRTNSFINLKDVVVPVPEITIDDLQENNLAKWRESYNDDCVIKLRTLMQYYGTEIIRNNIGKNTWVDITINTLIKDKNYYGYGIVADVRFDNEAYAIKNIGGKIVHVVRFGNINKPEHSSEIINTNMQDYVIVNKGTLLGLFYKVVEFVKEYMV